MTVRSDKRSLLILSIVFVGLMLILFGACRVKAEDETAAKNVYIGNTNVGGMTAEEINQVIANKLADYSDDVITINVGSNSVDVTAGELGVYQTNTNLTDEIMRIGKTGNIWERYYVNNGLEGGGAIVFDIETAASEDAVRAVVQQKCTALNVQRVDMTLSLGEDGVPHPTSKQDGIYVDEDSTVAAICEYMQNGWYGGYGEINASVTVDTAYGDEATFSQVTDILGTGSTSYAISEASENRNANIVLGAQKINGTVVYPGQEFSVLAMLEPFTAENGYYPAPSYEMGEVVDSYGGGVCQVSTTLYRAVLQSELDVTERYAHSMVVGYVQPSLDAAVSDGYKDFKFVNNTDYPIYIQGYAADGTITFNIYGHETRDPSRTLDFVGEVKSDEEARTVYELDSSLDVGTYEETAGSDGQYAEGYKIVYENGVEVSREKINASQYNYKDHTISIGTKGASSSQLAQLEAAVESGDMTQISAAAGGLTQV